MLKKQRPPLNKLMKNQISTKQLSSSPSKKNYPPANCHKYTASTPVPMRTPSPTRAMRTPSPTRDLATKKGSLTNISFKKVDLRKGVFSEKQNFVKDKSDKSLAQGQKIGSVLNGCKNNIFQMLSKQFKIDKKLIGPKAVFSVRNESEVIMGNQRMDRIFK